MLTVPSAALAQAIADEWAAQSDRIAVRSMPLTQLAATALDRAATDRQAYIRQIAVYGETDLVCYRAESPRALVVRQAKVWQPLVDWAQEALAAALTVTGGVNPVEQTSDTLAALRAAVDAHDAFELAALGLATAASGSLIVALALSHGRLDAGAAFEAGYLDELWQIEQWGRDEEAEIRQQNARTDLEIAARFFDLYRTR